MSKGGYIGYTYQNHVTELFLSKFQTTTDQGSSSSKRVLSQVIPMKQSRRMRSKELHYIDHPMLGILVRVTPIEE